MSSLLVLHHACIRYRFVLAVFIEITNCCISKLDLNNCYKLHCIASKILSENGYRGLAIKHLNRNLIAELYLYILSCSILFANVIHDEKYISSCSILFANVIHDECQYFALRYNVIIQTM